MRYVVKKSKLYYTYLILFVLFFLLASNSIKLEVRTTFSAIINNNKLIIKQKKSIPIIDESVYIYKDKGKEVKEAEVMDIIQENENLCLILKNNIEGFEENVRVEITTEYRSLLQRIFERGDVE